MILNLICANIVSVIGWQKPPSKSLCEYIQISMMMMMMMMMINPDYKKMRVPTTKQKKGLGGEFWTSRE